MQIEENNKRLEDKLAADDELMLKAEKRAKNAINREINKGIAKEVGKKAGMDALKTMAISALFTMLKEIINGLVRFFKAKEKSFKLFLEEMKNAIKSFFSKILSVLQTGASTLIGTIVSEIFGPIVSTFKKLASLIKQGVSSLIDAVKYLSDPQNKNQPFSIKAAQVGKIVTTALVAGGAIFLGELFEKLLMTYVPIMNIKIPLLGSLANIVGLFLASVVSGVVGAIVINLLDKLIAEKTRQDINEKKIDKGNEILQTQRNLLAVNCAQMENTKAKCGVSIYERHKAAKDYMEKTVEDIKKGDDMERIDTNIIEEKLNDVWAKLDDF